MMRDTLIQRSPGFADFRPYSVAPVLIQVPTIAKASVTSPHPATRTSFRPRRRRRLRREVRTVGYSLLTAMALSTLLPWSIKPSGSLPSTPVDTHTGRLRVDHRSTSPPPLVSISFEPVALAPVAEVKLPVVLPGYLLPDDGPDAEPAHAGY